MEGLRWFVTLQPPTDDESVNGVDVEGALTELAKADERLELVRVFDLLNQDESLVIAATGVVRLGTAIAKHVMGRNRPQWVHPSRIIAGIRRPRPSPRAF
ncbi:MAG: hypothetical protein R3F20_19005 [Planctomycetota bacterium]